MERRTLTIATIGVLAFGVFGGEFADASSSCQKSIACGTTAASSLDILNGSCLDSNALTYDLYPVSIQAGAQITVSASSPSFPPQLLLLDPTNAQRAIAANQNASSTSLTYNITTSGQWTIEIRNADISGDGPYSLMLSCSTTTTQPPPPDSGFTIGVTPQSGTLKHGESTAVSVFTSSIAPFAQPISITTSAPAGVTVTPPSFDFPSPGDGRAAATIAVTESATGGSYTIAFVATAKDATQRSAGFRLTVDAPCEPPIFTGGQQSVTITKGSAVTLTAAPHGTQPFAFQWYRGSAPFTFNPIAQATSATFTTAKLSFDDQFWVSAANSCGSASSQTYLVHVVNAAKRRAVHH